MFFLEDWGVQYAIGPHILVLLLQNRAQAATELLQELNSDVSGNFVEEVCVAHISTVLVMFNWKFKTIVYCHFQ